MKKTLAFSHKLAVAFVLLFSLFFGAVKQERASGAEPLPKQFENVGIKEKLGTKIDPKLPFFDSQGRQVSLSDYLNKDKPVLLTLNYFSCATLCSLQLQALIEGIQESKLTPGEKYELVTVSIDPTNTSAMASEKRKLYLDELDMPDADWNFLVGSEENIKSLAQSVGFSYRYDEESGQYAHGAAIYFLSPDGTITRYLYGVTYPGQQLRFALIDASEGKVGSTIEKFVLTCFQYINHEGRYTPFAFGMIRGGGIFAVSVMGLWLGAFWRREYSRRRKEYQT